MINFIMRHRLLAFYILVLVISWGGLLVMEGPRGIFNSRANSAVLPQLICLLALAGPSVAGIVMTGLRDGSHERLRPQALPFLQLASCALKGALRA
jgi:hypothetical protein